MKNSKNLMILSAIFLISAVVTSGDATMYAVNILSVVLCIVGSHICEVLENIQNTIKK